MKAHRGWPSKTLRYGHVGSEELGPSGRFSEILVVEICRFALSPLRTPHKLQEVVIFNTKAMEVAILGGNKPEAGPEHTIKPQSATPVVDTSDWPLLLKDYGRRMLLNSSELRVLILWICSNYPNWPFYPDTKRLHSIEKRYQILYQLWCYKPRQTFKPLES
jgi:hypothetical protein